MAPRRSGKVRVHELRVDNHSAGAQDNGDPHSHSHIKTQSTKTINESQCVNGSNKDGLIYKYLMYAVVDFSEHEAPNFLVASA